MTTLPASRLLASMAIADMSGMDIPDFELVNRAAANVRIVCELREPGALDLIAGCLSRAARDVHALNVRKGWWSNTHTGERIARNFGELLMLIVSEIAEGYDGWVADAKDDKLPERPMVQVELADALIRTFDTVAGFNLDIGAAVLRLTHEDITRCMYESRMADSCMRLVCHMADALEADRKGRPPEVKADSFVRFILTVMYTARWAGYDLAGAFHDKMVYNLGRADHDPANRRSGKGPAY